ncbi:membrane protein [Porphyromonas macacae]|uniref:Membrane protein n=1 Tax=Porphyromonas macacae TaxID=28115 RepID=A0A0A2E7R7_9PORP|nr:lysine exporter LysO family protein [Porphyromonas macacae]KGN74933.1 membrane protein [Porphyromonas macacae]
MKSSLLILIFFVAGLLVGHFEPVDLSNMPLSMIVLCLLMFFVGISIGKQPDKIRQMLEKNIRFFFLPLMTISGTLFGAFLSSFLLQKWNLGECLATGSGLGYYSLSSVIISEIKGPELGAIALLSNVFREIIALLGAPLFKNVFGPLAPIACGGATTADTTLPVIMNVCGTDYTAVSVYHGILCDFCVPFLVTTMLLIN